MSSPTRAANQEVQHAEKLRARAARDPIFASLIADDDDYGPAPQSPEIILRSPPSIHEMRELDRQFAAIDREGKASRRSGRDVAEHDGDDLLDIELDEPVEPLLTDEARQLRCQELFEDLRCETHVTRTLARDAVTCLGKMWRLDAILERLLSRPNAKQLDLARRIELVRESVHRTLVRDLDAIRQLRFPGGAATVQVAATAPGAHVHVNVNRQARPIPKRRLR